MVVFVAVRISFRFALAIQNQESSNHFVYLFRKGVDSDCRKIEHKNTYDSSGVAYLVASLVGLRCCAGHTNFKVLKIYVIMTGRKTCAM